MGFCALLLALLVAVRWWMGPVMSELMFDDERRAAPLVALSFLTGPSDALDAVDGKAAALSNLMRTEGASLAWFGSTQLVMTGSVADEWQRVAAVRFDKGAGFVDVVTSGDYRDVLGAEPETRRLLLVARSEPAAPLATDARVVLFLFAPGENKTPRTTISALVDKAVAHGGRLVWQTEVDVLQGDAEFGLMVAMQFDPEVGIENWLGDEHAALDRSLAQQSFHDIVVTVLEPLAMPAPPIVAEPAEASASATQAVENVDG